MGRMPHTGTKRALYACQYARREVGTPRHLIMKHGGKFLTHSRNVWCWHKRSPTGKATIVLLVPLGVGYKKSLMVDNGKPPHCGALIRSYGVGYGYDAFGEYASYNSVRDQVISLPALRLYERENKTSCIVDDLAPDMATTILEGNDSQQLLKSLSAHAGLGLDVGFFQAHVKVSYAHSDLKTNAYSFCTIMNNYKALSRHTDPYNLVEIARNNPKILTEGFRNCVNKISDAIEKDRLDKAAIRN